ncbi:peptidoglycan bridge formation glycyltransferase FemA/FemB family protein [Candidatus Saccharibacteria bacterium]|nr:peptidoglycan bridge formation glycyltransferase FemA/FemB family protein [Candidatus Saccharibacteria bacterium]
MSPENWQKVVKKYPEANFLQSPEYAKMNELLGDKVIFGDFGDTAHALMIVRSAKRGRYLEIPCGPLMDWTDTKNVKQIFKKIAETGKKEKCSFVRVRPQLNATEKNLNLLTKLGLKKSPMHLAAEHTVMVDLKCSEEEMLARMRRQTRYEVRRADKLGITVEKNNSEELFKEFHKVQVETAKRQGFIPPNLKTLLAEKEAFGGQIWIYVARNTEKKPIAYGIIIGNGREADYYEAASTNLNRKLPGAYALLWQAMRDLKALGYERFNLWGIAPAGQPNHRYAGVTTFKTGFGGEVIEYVPAHDLVLSKLGYFKDYVVESVRKKKRHL